MRIDQKDPRAHCDHGKKDFPENHILSQPPPETKPSTHHHHPLLNPPKNPNNQKPTRARKPHDRQAGHRVQHNAHINRTPIVLGGGRIGIIGQYTPSIRDDGRDGEVAKHPGQHDGGAEPLVVILVFGLFVDGFLGGLEFSGEGAEFGFILGIEIGVVGGDGDVDLATRFEVRGGEFLGLVVAFGAPGDVVGVTEGVDVEDVDVGWGEEEVLEETGEHVPGVEEEDGGDEVEEPGGAHGDDEGAEEFVGEELGEGEAVFGDLLLDGFDRDEDGGEEEVGHEDGPEVDLGHVEFVGALGSVAEGEDEAGDQDRDVSPFEDDGEDEAGGAEEVVAGEGDG